MLLIGAALVIVFSLKLRLLPVAGWGELKHVVLPAITLAECLATADLPGGVVNVLTGSAAEIAPWLASHLAANGIDLTGVTEPELARSLEEAAAENLKRVRRPTPEDLLATPALTRMTQFLETKTVWHPIGI